MGYFIILKQIVDIIYEFQILDYLMVIFALVLLGYGVVKKEIYKDIKGFVKGIDFVVLGMCVLFTIAFLDNIENSYGPYFKTLSVFLIFFLGRVYGDELSEKKKLIAAGFYILLYVNLIYRTVEYIHERLTGECLPRQKWNFAASGGLYYYKTDLSIAVIISVIFIYVYAKDNWFKYLSIIVVPIILIFSSEARIGQLIIVLEYLLIIVMEFNKRSKFKLKLGVKFIEVIGIILLAGLTVFFVFIQLSIIKQTNYESLGIDPFLENRIETLFHSRQLIWWDAMNYFSNQDFLHRLIGIDLWSCSLRNSRGERFHCLYFKNIYSIGYIGSYLYLTFIIMVCRNIALKKDSIVKTATVAMWMMFLVVSFSMEAFEYTQMSWFPFLFAGALVSKEE